MTHRDRSPELQNIPIPLAPEQRRTACLLKEAVLRAAYPGVDLKRLAFGIDYSSLERRVLAHMRRSPPGDVGGAE